MFYHRLCLSSVGEGVALLGLPDPGEVETSWSEGAFMLLSTCPAPQPGLESCSCRCSLQQPLWSPCVLPLCHNPLRSVITKWETTEAHSACSRVYSHSRANPSPTTANGGQSLGSVSRNWTACPNPPDRHCMHSQRKRKNMFFPSQHPQPQWPDPLKHTSLCRDPGYQPFRFAFRCMVVKYRKFNRKAIEQKKSTTPKHAGSKWALSPCWNTLLQGLFEYNSLHTHMQPHTTGMVSMAVYELPRKAKQCCSTAHTSHEVQGP